MRRLATVVLARLDEIVLAEWDVDRLVHVQVEVAEADLTRAVRVPVPAFVERNDGLRVRPQNLLVEEALLERDALAI